MKKIKHDKNFEKQEKSERKNKLKLSNEDKTKMWKNNWNKDI